MDKAYDDLRRLQLTGQDKADAKTVRLAEEVAAMIAAEVSKLLPEIGLSVSRWETLRSVVGAHVYYAVWRSKHAPVPDPITLPAE
jgi:hypothetical protein